EILSAKSGTFTTSVGEVPLPDDPNASPSYNPGFSPAFAAFSFGAYTHRNGMSQYGAKGRAEAGQSAEQILSFYYPGATLNKSYSVPATIDVIGYGTRAFEDEYMKRIYEMPNSFPKEALKAQAVAARSFAIRQGGSICPTEACQVYKDTNKGGAWEEAVNETRGWALEGGPNAQYSSTTGGYTNNAGWDTTSNNKDAWTQGAFEKLAGSPWFYKGWYTQSYSISSANCGHSHPWLNLEEMSDTLNAYLIQNKSGVDNGRITPITTSCWGGNPYSMDEARNLADSVSGGKVTSISGVSVSYSNDGKTANITFSTNRGDISISGSDFKQIFNLRAPGYISIKSPLYNIERK
ncbi:MAG TPA: SpoIID/LytB domain-containing protein, partial [Thermodesulfovibrionia bacterium]|nr:SpoIID/LytB domain-containing protein [Thermodesulfovibrionia bacterium]